jgi:hypothetical protein
MKSLILYPLFGIPLGAYGGMLALSLFLATAYVGHRVLTKPDKTKLTIHTHVWMARTAIAIALLHGLAFLWIFLG